MSPLLSNPLATPAQLAQRVQLSGLPQDLLDVIFVATQMLTQAAGLLLEQPQSITAQANVLVARYWLLVSPMEHEFSHVSAAALYLISKDGPLPRPPRDFSTTYHYLLSPSSPLFKPTSTSTSTSTAPSCPPPKPLPLPSEPFHQTFKSNLLTLETHLLTTLSFQTTTSLPHPLAITYLQALSFASTTPRTPLSARTVAHLNTALLSPQLLYLTHQPHELAAAAVWLACRDVGAKMPEDSWWELFDVDREVLGFLAASLNSVEGLVRRQRAEFEVVMGGRVSREGVEEELRRMIEKGQ